MHSAQVTMRGMVSLSPSKQTMHTSFESSSAPHCESASESMSFVPNLIRELLMLHTESVLHGFLLREATPFALCGHVDVVEIENDELLLVFVVELIKAGRFVHRPLVDPSRVIDNEREMKV